MEHTPQVEGRLLRSRLVFATVSKSYHKTANHVNYFILRRRTCFLRCCFSKNFFCFALLFIAFKDQVVGFGSRPLWGAVSDNMISIAQIKKSCQQLFFTTEKQHQHDEEYTTQLFLHVQYPGLTQGTGLAKPCRRTELAQARGPRRGVASTVCETTFLRSCPLWQPPTGRAFRTHTPASSPNLAILWNIYLYL